MKKQIIPTFSLDRQVKNFHSQFTSALTNVLDSQQFIGGSYIQAIEKQLAQYLNVKHVISCNSGTDALWIALKAMAMPANAIVLTTPFSFIASSSEIVANNAHPVFIDIQPDTLNINPDLMEQWLRQNASMVNGVATHKALGFPIVGMIPVDIFGQCADYDRLHIIAQEWNLWMIEDTAQAIGAEFKNKKAGTLGTVGAFSFYPTKNLGAFGDAGCCATNDDALAEKILQLRNHGRKAGYDYECIGVNSRMDAFQAAILSVKLPLLHDMNERRRVIAARYNAALKNVSFLQLPHELVGKHVYHQYSVVVQDGARQQLEKHLADHGVQTRIFYPMPLPDIAFLRTHPALVTTNPVAAHTTRNIISLPMWPELTDQEVDYVIECIKSFQPSKEKEYSTQATI